ncbi:dihydrofolate reductase family protein [Pseudoflavitalea rhizosphaerae]|uniref:dihydrofolate reductase family protein n=1 Tax=Pseudoflavitalea rhizosphaerae TaxID=1884793 RepID=UPI000F8ED411|nr:dihydrofolate reductase family protein [Pseudoflavitalea rhizosphaerae]
MRKLIFQVNMTLDGYVARPDGKTDWMWLSGERDEEGFKRVIELAGSSDTILMGRKMSREFIDYWEDVVDNQPQNPMNTLAQLMVNHHKIIFSRTQKEIKGRNVTVENNELATVVNALKQQPGKNIIVYGGATFVSSLISLNLIDEYYLFINPVAIGEGMPIFREQKILKLESVISYKNGKVLHKYLPA